MRKHTLQSLLFLWGISPLRAREPKGAAPNPQFASALLLAHTPELGLPVGHTRAIAINLRADRCFLSQNVNLKFEI